MFITFLSYLKCDSYQGWHLLLWLRGHNTDYTEEKTGMLREIGSPPNSLQKTTAKSSCSVSRKNTLQIKL